MKKEIKPLLDEYLESVKDMHEAETDPHFYIRLRGRMQKNEGWTFPLKPSWIVACLALLLVINGFMLVNKSANKKQSNTTVATPLQNFAAAYDLDIQSTY